MGRHGSTHEDKQFLEDLALLRDELRVQGLEQKADVVFLNRDIQGALGLFENVAGGAKGWLISPEEHETLVSRYIGNRQSATDDTDRI